MGRLDIRICGARHLPDVQLIGKIDPYCIVKLENQTHRTSVCDDSTNPVWNEVFKFIVADQQSAQIRFELWNSNMVSDDFLGCYHLSLSGLIKGQVKDEWYLLQQCKSNAELHIRLLAHDFGIEMPGLAPPPANAMAYQGFYQAPPAPAPQSYPTAPAPVPQPYAAPPPAQPGYGYPPQQQQPGGYAQAPPGYPPSQPGYAPPPQSYPPAQTGYPPSQPGYPPAGGYPPATGGYPPAGAGGYPPAAGGYGGGYPPAPTGYPPQAGFSPLGAPGGGYVQPGAAFSAPGYPQPGGIYRIRPRNAEFKVLGCQGNHGHNGTHIVLWDMDGLPNQNWRVDDRGNGFISLAPMHAPNMRLDGNNGTGQICHLWDIGNPTNPNQQWRLEPTDGGYFRLHRMGDNAVLDVANYATHNGATLHCWSQVTGQPNQQFRFERIY